MIAVAPDAKNVGASAGEISGSLSLSSEGELPTRRLYRKPRVKKRRFPAKTEHPRKLYGIDKIKSGVITTPPQPNIEQVDQNEIIDISLVIPECEVSAWNAFIFVNKLFSNCYETITWVWNRCEKNEILPENTANNHEVTIQIEDGETEI